MTVGSRPHDEAADPRRRTTTTIYLGAGRLHVLGSRRVSVYVPIARRASTARRRSAHASESSRPPQSVTRGAAGRKGRGLFPCHEGWDDGANECGGSGRRISGTRDARTIRPIFFLLGCAAPRWPGPTGRRARKRCSTARFPPTTLPSVTSLSETNEQVRQCAIR